MLSATDPRFISDPSDWLAFQQLNAGTPDIFTIFLNTVNESVEFKVGTSNIGRARKQVSSYNIHFLSQGLASPSILFSLEGQRSGFRLSDIVASTGAPGPGGVAYASSQNQYGKAGYYFAAPVNQAGQESIYFAGPLVAPLPGNIVNAQVPPDVSDPAVVVTTETVNGYDTRRVTVSATVPSNGQGVVAVAVLNPGSGYTFGDNPQCVFSGGGGSGAMGTAIINSGGGVSRVEMVETGSGYILTPTVTAPGGSAVLEALVGNGTDFFGYQIYIEGYFGDSQVRESQMVSDNNRLYPGQTMQGSFTMLPDLTASSTTLYFVAISSTGARRTDPTAAPSVTIPGGIV